MLQYGYQQAALRKWFKTLVFALLVSGMASFSWAREDRPSLPMPLAPHALLLDLALVKESNRLVAVGERGHVLISDDRGRSFRQVITPSQSTLTSLFFQNEKIGWAAGHDTLILATTDGGETWEKRFYDPDRGKPIMDICFVTPSFGIAVGAYGLYLETRDGGLTWEDKYFEALDDPEFGQVHFNAFTHTPEGIFFIAGEAGFLARSLDSGESWEALEKIYPGSYFSARFTRKGTLIVAGLRGNAFRSSDNGGSWERIITQTLSTLNHCAEDETGRIVISGLGSTLLISHDDGVHFTPVPREDRISIAATALPEKGVLVVAGDNGVIRIAH